MSEYPEITMPTTRQHTHEVVITLANKEPRIIKVHAHGSFSAINFALREMLGADRDYTLPAMLIKVRRLSDAIH